MNPEASNSASDPSRQTPAPISASPQGPIITPPESKRFKTSLVICVVLGVIALAAIIRVIGTSAQKIKIPDQTDESVGQEASELVWQYPPTVASPWTQKESAAGERVYQLNSTTRGVVLTQPNDLKKLGVASTTQVLKDNVNYAAKIFNRLASEFTVSKQEDLPLQTINSDPSTITFKAQEARLPQSKGMAFVAAYQNGGFP